MIRSSHVKQIFSQTGTTPNPNVVKKDNEKLENLAIDLQNGFEQNRASGFQHDNEALIEGMCQYKDYQLVKRLQLRAVKYLKIVSINYKPYPEYAEVMTKALNNFIAAMSELIVNMYRANNPTLFKKDKYYTFIDTHTKNISQELFNNLSPLSHMVNESTYSGL